MPTSSLEDRFRKKLGQPTETGCIEWTATINNRGYGLIRRGQLNEGRILAHRLAYELAFGPIPDGLHVLHACDNRLCCNHDHLFVGTAADNVADMLSKDRQRKSRFSEHDVKRMRELSESGLLQREIADEYGVSRPLICMLLSGKVKASERTQPL